MLLALIFSICKFRNKLEAISKLIFGMVSRGSPAGPYCKMVSAEPNRAFNKNNPIIR